MLKTSQLIVKTRSWIVYSIPLSLLLLYVTLFYLRFGYPVPSVHDEFSYLLSGDTFARRRLANPTPPAWQSFESLHINMVPSYVSMYPPGQGLFLALGQALFGHPWWGVVVSGAAFLCATAWALLGWMPRSWALLGSFTATTYLIGTYWMSSYWGGNVAATGGALILGAVGYSGKRSPVVLGAVWALGCTMLVYSRPYPGAVLIAFSMIPLVIGCMKTRQAGGDLQILRGLTYGALPVALLGIGWLMAYCYATTGKVTRLPYSDNVEQYQIRKTFFWQKDRPMPEYRHEQMKNVYVGLLRRDTPWRDLYMEIAARLAGIHGGLVLVIGLPVFLWSWRTPSNRWVFLCACAGLASLLPIPYINPHYYAPFSAVLLAGMILGLRQVTAYPAWVATAVVVWCLLVSVQISRRGLRSYAPEPWAVQRQAVQDGAAKLPGRHLIFVKYTPDHNWFQEWVYNSAEITEQKVIWARWWTPEGNRALLNHFPDRKVWILEPDRAPVQLEEYVHVRQME